MVVLDGRKMMTKSQAHTYLARRFDFPFYYEKNIDAMKKILGEREEEVYLFYAKRLFDRMPEYGKELVRAFYEIAHKHDGFYFWTNLGEDYCMNQGSDRKGVEDEM